MKCVFTILAYFLAIHKTMCVGLVKNPKLYNYLQIQSESVDKMFTEKSHLVYKRTPKSVEIDEIGNVSYPGSYTTATIFTFFNTTYILIDNVVAFIATTDGTFSVNDLVSLADKGKIMFTRAVQYNQLSILLTTLESETHIYSVNNRSISSIQSILTPFATDAKFFTNNGDLYLIIIYNKGDNLAQMSVFKWLGTHFDEIDTIFTTGAFKIHSFSTRSSEIIIILQHLPDKEILSSVYEFNFEKIRKVQHLRTTAPGHIDSYPVGTKIYVILFEKSRNNTIYLWDGTKLVKFSKFKTDAIITRTEVLQTNESSIIIAPLKDRLQVFRPSPEGLQMEEEKGYKSNYSVILDIQKRENTKGSITFIVGLSEDNIININVMSFKVHLAEMEKDQNKDMLRECFNNLENMVYSTRKNLNNTQEILSQAFTKDYSHARLGAMKKKPNNVTGLDKIRKRLHKMQLLLNNYEETEENDIIINGRTIIKGSVEAEKLSARDVSIRKINGQFWTPEQWLMYQEPQTVTGPIKISDIIVTDLETAHDLTLFRDLLLRTGDQLISGIVTIGNLTANEMFAQKVNDVAVEEIYLIQDPRLITGRKTFNKIRTTQAKIISLNGKSPDNVLSVFTGSETLNPVFDNDVQVENLTVEYINDVHWDTFMDSIFRIGETTEINGNLTFAEIKTVNLTLTTLNDVKIEDLLTTSTDQIIDSDIELIHVNGENLTTGTVNNIRLVDSVVQLNDNATIEGPVKFDRLNVEKDLELVGKVDYSFFLKDENHIIGTNESDLFQTYRGKVKVYGNLYLNNITLEPEAQLFISGEEISPNICDIYWTKNTHQVIPVRFLAKRGLSVPHLLTDKLNSFNMSQYMVNNNENKLDTSYYFKDVVISGDVVLNKAAKHTPDFDKIEQEAVKTNGTYFLNGKKTYLNSLRAETLATNVLDGIVVLDTLSIYWAGNITGKKIFKNVIIEGNFTSDVQSPGLINDINITELLDKAIYIDQPQDIKRLHFKNITVSDLYVTTLNNHHPNEYILNLNSTDKIEGLIINGDVRIQDAQNVSTINDIEFEELLNNPLKVGPSGIFQGDIQFLGHVKVHNLFTLFMNDMNLRDLTSRFLLRNVDQNITASYSFINVKADNIVASKINNVSIENPVDVSSKLPQTIHAPNGIEFTTARLLKSLQTNDTSPCNLEEALKRISDPPTKEWHSMEIHKNVTFMDPDNILYRVFEQTVTKNSKNIIQAPVNFTNNILANNVNSSKDINGVNIQDIIEDAVLKDSEVEQVITGQKYFPTLNVWQATVLKNTDSPVVNDVDILKLVKVMVHKDDDTEVFARGTKTFFGGLQCDRFYSQKVLNIDPENLVNLQNPQTIPSALFEFLGVENDLNISYVNLINFDRILQNRLLTKGPDVQTVSGIYYFEDIEIENMSTISINDIKIDDVIFDTEQQNITSPKYFMETVEIFGNAESKYINGFNITGAYENSVMKAEEANIDGSITLLRPSIVNGSINADYINGFAVEDIKGILYKGAPKVEVQKIHGMKNHIIDVVKRNLPHAQAMASDYMYIEKSDKLQISVPHTTSANIISSKGYVLIHVTGEESGRHCGLPDTCKCPTQFSMEISPEHSVAVLPNKGSQRTFSYDDDNMIIHFLTNSVSTDSNCRTESSRVLNEVSMMTWTTLSTANTTGKFYQYDKFITGYISGAEFFSLNGQSYAIIGRYYDPSINTHDLDCIVIKFIEGKSKAIEIQKIPTKGAWSIYLFHAAQGVTLIIGNVNSSHMHHEDEETKIFTFNENKQQFDILRTVPYYGCSMATGVVLGADSLIVLSHRNAPLQVLKYDHYYNNYYFYQSIELEAPVLGISVFYTGGFGISDAYLCIVTGNESFFIYSFRFIEGWKLESSGELEGLRNLVPFQLNKQPYLFAPSTKMSSLLTVVKHGSV